MKIVCDECGWCGEEYDLLESNNPFVRGESIYACPDCREIDKYKRACMVQGCCNPISKGELTEPVDGIRHYVTTCHKHDKEQVTIA